MPLVINVVRNMDCLDGLASLPDGVIDVIVTSPPYFVAGVAPPGEIGISVGQSPAEYVAALSERLRKALRTLKLTGVMFLNLSDGREWLRLPSRIVTDLCEKAGTVFLGEIIWPKDTIAFTGARSVGRAHDSIFVLAKGSGHLFNPRTSSVWRLPGVDDLHFPEELVRRCFTASGLRTGLVLDPFMGTGTTGVVAVQEGWDFLGFELNPERCALAADRIEHARQDRQASV